METFAVHYNIISIVIRKDCVNLMKNGYLIEYLNNMNNE